MSNKTEDKLAELIAKLIIWLVGVGIIGYVAHDLGFDRSFGFWCLAAVGVGLLK